MVVNRNDTLSQFGAAGDPHHGPPRRRSMVHRNSPVTEALQQAAASQPKKLQDPLPAPVEPVRPAPQPQTAEPDHVPESPLMTLNLNITLRSTPERIINLLQEITSMNTDTNATTELNMNDNTNNTNDAAAPANPESTMAKARRKAILKKTGQMVGRFTIGLAAVAGAAFAGKYLYDRYGVQVPTE